MGTRLHKVDKLSPYLLLLIEKDVHGLLTTIVLQEDSIRKNHFQFFMNTGAGFKEVLILSIRRCITGGSRCNLQNISQIDGGVCIHAPFY